MVASVKVRATAVLIEDEHILLTEQRVSASGKRRWSLPGGGVEFGETLEACLIREIREETGLTVAIGRLLYLCDRIQDGRHTIHITFKVHRVDGRLRVGTEPDPTPFQSPMSA